MELKGIVFNIQKFSIHDGPGVRTNVFLKGCPLRCKWCSNPESQAARPQVLYHSAECVHCKKCVASCPEQAVSADDSGRLRIDFTRCSGCMVCVHGCPGRALTCEGEEKTADEVFEICMQDLDFYEESGGGVTLSGGEALMQPDFVEALLQRLKEKGVHTAIETMGCAAPEIFQRLAPRFDLLLFDVKHWDCAKHREGTGVGNEQIIQNLRWGYGQGLNILPRIPVIPGFNGAPEDGVGIAGLLKEIGFTRAQLLPFHQMGEKKYELLNRNYELTGVKALHPEDLTAYRQIFLDRGIDCFF